MDSDLYGAWELMKLEMGGMSIQFTLIINEGEIIASNTCAFKEYRVLAEVSSPAVITSEEIRWIHRSRDHDPAAKLSWQDVAVADQIL